MIPAHPNKKKLCAKKEVFQHCVAPLMITSLKVGFLQGQRHRGGYTEVGLGRGRLPWRLGAALPGSAPEQGPWTADAQPCRGAGRQRGERPGAEVWQPRARGPETRPPGGIFVWFFRGRQAVMYSYLPLLFLESLYRAMSPRLR